MGFNSYMAISSLQLIKQASEGLQLIEQASEGYISRYHTLLLGNRDHPSNLTIS
jgi:hypothetical protein